MGDCDGGYAYGDDIKKNIRILKVCISYRYENV